MSLLGKAKQAAGGLAGKAKDLADQHGDKVGGAVGGAIGKVGGLADKATKGKFHDKIEKVESKAAGLVHKPGADDAPTAESDIERLEAEGGPADG